ncbi:MAG: Hsp20/alpha crystallin family protein [Gammaproteobacteria bacterium PRO9]|nr:Hsp20/alpha crystallin family protein [Gammaproteobacteria bacterium PRO9]
MTLVNWSPLRELDDLFNQYGRVLGRSATRSAEDGDGNVVEWRPVANISETPDAYLVKAELPEVDKKDIDVSVHDGVITLRGERRLENTSKDEKHHRIESFYGTFARSFSLPADADESKIEAESKDGVLTVRIPKSEARKPRAIEVQVR